MKLWILAVSVLVAGYVNAAELVIASDRPQARFASVIQKFTEQTGVKVQFLELSYADILKRLEAGTEPTDLVITKDLSYLTELSKKSLLQSPGQVSALDIVRPQMRGENNEWVALTFRVRGAVFDPARVNSSELSFKDLATDKWKGRLCLRSGKSAYNEALVAFLIQNYGETKAREIVAGWISNLAVPPLENDVKVIEAVTNRACDVGIVNHYYLAGELNKNPRLNATFSFLQDGFLGAHTNGTGAAFVKGSQKVQDSTRLVELMLTEEFQLPISAAHFDYPARMGLKPNTLIEQWGTFQTGVFHWTAVALQLPAAKAIISEVGFQ